MRRGRVCPPLSACVHPCPWVSGGVRKFAKPRVSADPAHALLNTSKEKNRNVHRLVKRVSGRLEAHGCINYHVQSRPRDTLLNFVLVVLCSFRYKYLIIS